MIRTNILVICGYMHVCSSVRLSTYFQFRMFHFKLLLSRYINLIHNLFNITFAMFFRAQQYHNQMGFALI